MSVTPIRTRTFEATPAGVTPAGPVDAGVQGDHNATEVVFVLDDVLNSADYRYRFEYEDGAGCCDSTGMLTPDEGCVRWLLPLAWTRSGGIGLLRLVVTLPGLQGDEQTVYTGTVRLRFAARSAGEGQLSSVQPLLSSLLEEAAETIRSAGGKADKVAGAAAGNIAALDAEGNLIDSGMAAGAETFKPYQSTDAVIADAAKCAGDYLYLLWMGEDLTFLPYQETSLFLLGKGDIKRLHIANGTIQGYESLGNVLEGNAEQDVGDVAAALDGIIAMQEALIGGESA